ncbi:aldehyde dehydrogenase family protein, partial [Vibrio parahaemolyticus VPTS-2010]
LRFVCCLYKKTLRTASSPLSKAR